MQIIPYCFGSNSMPVQITSSVSRHEHRHSTWIFGRIPSDRAGSDPKYSNRVIGFASQGINIGDANQGYAKF